MQSKGRSQTPDRSPNGPIRVWGVGDEVTVTVTCEPLT